MSLEYTIDSTLIRNALQDLSGPVAMHYYTSDVESGYTYTERRLLQEIERHSEHLTLYPHIGHWDAEREAQVGIARTPAIALYGATDTGIRYYGAPEGDELTTFLGVLKDVATGAPDLRAETQAHLQRLIQPIHLEVVVLPT